MSQASPRSIDEEESFEFLIACLSPIVGVRYKPRSKSYIADEQAKAALRSNQLTRQGARDLSLRLDQGRHFVFLSVGLELRP